MLARGLISAARALSAGRAWRPALPLLVNSLRPVVRPFSADADLVTICVPDMGDSITEGTILEFGVDVGEFIALDETLVTIETDKVTVEVPAPDSGVIKELLVEAGDEVEVGAPLVKLAAGEGGEPAKPKAEEPAAAAAAETTPAPTPAVEDKPAAAAPSPPTPATPPPAASPPPKAKATPPTPAAPAVTGARSETRVKMSRMRQRIAQRLKESQNTAACLTTYNEVDMSNLIAMRKMYKEEFKEEHEVPLGFMSAFVKATATTLQEMPVVNAYLDGETHEVVYHDFVDISIAVASPRGLVVPVLRDCQDMSFAGVEKTIGDLAAKARDESITLEEMAGGTFSITNGGVFGSLMSMPIINPPQSAILGMHATKMRPIAVDGKVEIRPMMYVALTYDHRLVDGREAVTFLCKVRDRLEDPRRLLLDL